MLGKALPKRILRPFVVMANERLDGKQYVLIAANDKLEFIDVLKKLLFLATGVFILLYVYVQISEKKILPEEIIILNNIVITLIIVSIIIFIVNKVLRPSKFEIFDRENGIITIPRPFSKRVWISAPWEEWQGRIWLGASSVGVSNHHLMLTHIPSGRGWEMSSSTTGVDPLLSYWSFLVQYMDKTQPLPNVGELSNYEKTTEGLGSWAEYENNLKSGRLRDPWVEWQTELKANPELDVFYEPDTIDHNHA